METAIASFFSITTLVFCLIVWFAVLSFRKAVEYVASKLAKVTPDAWEARPTSLWRDCILPVVPFVLGVVIVLLAPEYPYPEAFATSLQGKMAFGLVAGGCSGFVYRFAKAQLKKLSEKGPE